MISYKWFFRIILCAFLLCLGSCKKSCNKDVQNVLRIGTNANFPPFESVDEKGQLVGFDIDMGHEIARELKKEAKFVEFDFDALILALKQGQIDMILSGLSITESRKKEIDMIPYQGKPLTDVSFLFWEKLPEGITTVEELGAAAKAEHKAITVQAGHFLEGYLKEAGIEVKTLAGPPEQLLDIKYNKSLAAAVDTTNAKAMAERDSNLKIITITLPKDKWDLGNGIGIKKGNDRLLSEVSAAVKALKENGAVSRLEKKWLEGQGQ